MSLCLLRPLLVVVKPLLELCHNVCVHVRYRRVLHLCFFALGTEEKECPERWFAWYHDNQLISAGQAAARFAPVAKAQLVEIQLCFVAIYFI